MTNLILTLLVTFMLLLAFVDIHIYISERSLDHRISMLEANISAINKLIYTDEEYP